MSSPDLTEFSDETSRSASFPSTPRDDHLPKPAVEYWFFQRRYQSAIRGSALQPYGLTAIQGRAGLYEITGGGCLNRCRATLRLRETSSAGRAAAAARAEAGRHPAPDPGGHRAPALPGMRWSHWPNGSATVCPALPSSTGVTTRPSTRRTRRSRYSALGVLGPAVAGGAGRLGVVVGLRGRRRSGHHGGTGLLAVGSEVHVDPAQHVPAGIALGRCTIRCAGRPHWVAGLGEADRDGAEALAVSLSPRASPLTTRRSRVRRANPARARADVGAAGAAGRGAALGGVSGSARADGVVGFPVPRPGAWAVLPAARTGSARSGHVYELRGSPHRFLALDRATADTTDPDVAAALERRAGPVAAGHRDGRGAG